MKVFVANRIVPDGKSRSAASHLGLCCLPVSNKKTRGLNELSIGIFNSFCSFKPESLTLR